MTVQQEQRNNQSPSRLDAFSPSAVGTQPLASFGQHPFPSTASKPLLADDSSDLYRTNQGLRDALQRSQVRASHYQDQTLQVSSFKEQPRFTQTERVTVQHSERPPPNSSSQRDLLEYYQNLSETYRKKYLDLESEFFFQKQKHESDLGQVHSQTHNLEDKQRRDYDELDQRYQQQVNDKDLQINTLQR